MIISVFGKNGSGKTTLVNHLSKTLSDNNYFVGIVSLEMRYNSIGRTLGIKIDETKSIINALSQKDIRQYSTRYTDNVYVYSLSDIDDITKYDAIQNISKDENILSEFLSKLNDYFDYVIIDLSEMIIDNFTYFCIKHSDKLINVIESRPESIAFSSSHKEILNSFLIINVLNKHEESIVNLSTIKNIYGNIDTVINFDISVIKDERQNKVNKYILSKMSEMLNNLDCVVNIISTT